MKITVFDFDGTLTYKDTLKLFLFFVFGPYRCVFGLLILFPWLAGYKVGLIDGGKAKERLFRYFFKGMNLERFNRLCVNFQSVLKRYIRQDVLALLCKARECGNRIYIVSASPENWILPWAEEQGVKYVLSTKLAVDEKGRLTGNFATQNCNGREKVRRLISAIPDLQSNRENYVLYAYGNSKGDKALIDFADQGWYV